MVMPSVRRLVADSAIPTHVALAWQPIKSWETKGGARRRSSLQASKRRDGPALADEAVVAYPAGLDGARDRFAIGLVCVVPEAPNAERGHFDTYRTLGTRRRRSSRQARPPTGPRGGSWARLWR